MWFSSGYSLWGQWSACDALCGGGMQNRTRACFYGDKQSEDADICKMKGLEHIIQNNTCNENITCKGKTFTDYLNNNVLLYDYGSNSATCEGKHCHNGIISCLKS